MSNAGTTRNVPEDSGLLVTASWSLCSLTDAQSPPDPALLTQATLPEETVVALTERELPARASLHSLFGEYMGTTRQGGLARGSAKAKGE